MTMRLKQRLLSYSAMFLITLLLVKLFILSRECNNGLQHSSNHQHSVNDAWNINEHQIEQNVVQQIDRLKRDNRKNEEDDESDVDYGPHKLAIIVPFRNRFEELREFVPHMKKYLKEKTIKNRIYIINQIDGHRFNRASLINVGMKMAQEENCDYMAMHDVDLLPLNKDLNYQYPDLGPFHVAGPKLHPKYHYKTFVGGILLLSMEQFNMMNGMSNKFWGWGREDDEFYMRIVDAGYKIYRHGAEITTGYDTFKHEHSVERKRDYVRLPGQQKAMFNRDRETGLSTLKYEKIKRNELLIDGYACSVIDIKLPCDTELTPWCDLPRKKRKS